MYALLWRHLPGPWPVRVVICLLLAAAVLAACAQWLFPWVASWLPMNDAGVHAAAAPAQTVVEPAARWVVTAPGAGPAGA